MRVLAQVRPTLSALPEGTPDRGALRQSPAIPLADGLPAVTPLTTETGPRPLSDLVNEARAFTEAAALGSLVQQLGGQIQITKRRWQLETWLRLGGESTTWLRQGIPALGAVLEAAVLSGLPGAQDKCLEILMDPQAELQTATVAAQRLRASRVPLPAELRERTDRALRDVIDVWKVRVDTEWRAQRALPSVPYVGGEAFVPWLCEQIRTGQPKIAQGGALGILDWSLGRIPSGTRPSQGAKEQLATALLWRLASAGVERDLADTLLWAVGGMATDQNRLAIAAAIAAAYLAKDVLHRAAALEAGRALLQEADKGHAALSAAFQGQEESLQRMMSQISKRGL